MGVQCKLLGHVRDSTEFEERQETRPDGTVLICREYQVCRRCGDREEMYRNERVLTPRAAETDTGTADTTERADASGQGSEPPRASEGGDAGGAPTAECRDREPADSAGREGVTDDAVILSDSSADRSQPTADTPARIRADGTGSPPSAHSTDDAVVISESSTDVNPSSGEKNGHPGSTAERGGSSRDTGGGSPPTSSFGAGGESDGRIHCTGCRGEWRRDATSLRAGDLCPACRQAYVEET